jgi:uncharacterized protein (DUF2132 family)
VLYAKVGAFPRLDRQDEPFQIEHRAVTSSDSDPLHGVTLEHILTTLVAHYEWSGLAERIDIRCFKSDPSIKSSLTFLRRTPWAREKVERLYIKLQRTKR